MCKLTDDFCSPSDGLIFNQVSYTNQTNVGNPAAGSTYYNLIIKALWTS